MWFDIKDEQPRPVHIISRSNWAVAYVLDRYLKFRREVRPYQPFLTILVAGVYGMDLGKFNIKHLPQGTPYVKDVKAKSSFKIVPYKFMRAGSVGSFISLLSATTTILGCHKVECKGKIKSMSRSLSRSKLMKLRLLCTCIRAGSVGSSVICQCLFLLIHLLHIKSTYSLSC